MENNKNTTQSGQQDRKEGIAENQKANYTEASVNPDETPKKEKSDLQNTNSDKKEDDLSGDLAGNASGNTDAESQ